MVLSAKWSKSGNGGWGMCGFLLIFFPEDDSSSKKKTLLSLPSSSSSSAARGRPTTAAAFSGSLISSTQSTLSICGLLVFTTVLLFTLSTFETAAAAAHRHRSPRRLLLTDHHPPSRLPSFPLATRIVKFFNPRNSQNGAVKHSGGEAVKALQGMGVLYRRGTRAMADLIVAHVSDAVEERKFRAFLRILHTDGILARSDLVFIFSSSSISSKFSPLIQEENESLLKLVLSYDELNPRNDHDSHGLAGLTRYLRTKKEEKKEAKQAIWGKGYRGKNHSELDESTRPSYGSVVGFDASELDPANSLSGFLDHVPTGLRRWACYPMLLGRVRRSYKHVALADVSSVVVLNDPFTRVRNRSPESVYLWTHPDSESDKRGKRQSSKPQQEQTLNPGIVVGGSRGVRRLSDAVLTQIVRATIEHKGKAGKNSVTELGIVNQLVHGGHLLKNVNVIASAERVPDAGYVFGPGPKSASAYSNTVVQWGRRSVILRDLWCWSDLHLEVYRDCLTTQQ